jgi:hypothetical protein
MICRILVTVCFLSAICCFQQVKVDDDYRSSRVVLRCNDSQALFQKRGSYCAAKSTRCVVQGTKIATRDEISHPKEAHYIACLAFEMSSLPVSIK